MGGEGGEKTEKATPKKRRDARKKGQVLKSQDASTTFCTIIMFGLLFAIWPWFVGQMTNVFHIFHGAPIITQAAGGMNTNEITTVFGQMMLSLLMPLLPILGVALLAGIAINLVQVGFLYSTETLKPKFNKLNPVKGLKQMVEPKKLVELAKNLMKVGVVGWVAFSIYRGLIEEFPTYLGQDVYLSFVNIMQDAFIMALQMCIAMVFISVGDYIYQWWKFEKDLKMSKKEVKDEHKMMEGDPQIKGKIRQKQMQMSAMRMMSQVPEADVVITNPTHYAVALKYDSAVSSSPTVLAKGQDYVARKIRETAMDNDISIVENPPIAQSLYSLCEVGDEIPEELYQAVADILVFVYRQKGKIPRAAG